LSRNAELKLAVVVPRYGAGTGGAEFHARLLAGKLAEVGHSVEVLATCAASHYTWANELPAGSGREGPLTVSRFPTDDRDLGIHGELERAIVLGFPIGRDEELLWLRHGVSSSGMEEHLAEHGDRYDLVLVFQYLFGTSYFAVAACPERAVVVPCLHDESYSRLRVVREMLERARGVIFNAEAEAALGLRLAPGIKRWSVVGVGFEPPEPGDAAAFMRRHKLSEPTLLYVGRRESGKNLPLVIDYFQRYKHRRGGDLRLVVAGPEGDVALPARKDAMWLGDTWPPTDALFRSGTIVCQPSRNESFSIVLMQAWQAERPALVHGQCDVTREHCELSGGGLWFSSYAEFEAVLDRLLGDAELRARMGRSGRAYVEREYSWESVLGRFHQALADWGLGGVAVSAANVVRSPDSENLS
jgi:glycosyltransferase involved in cell wall biosynthesis